MARLSKETVLDHPVKLLFMGPSGSGKTCSLLSLVQAGYDLRIIDLDKGTAPLVSLVDHYCEDRLPQLDIEFVSDQLKGGKTGIEVTKATGYPGTMSLLTKWTDETRPTEWGPDTILVLDSLTRLSDYTFNYEKKLNPSVRDPRQWFHMAQQRLRQFFDLLATDEFNVHVIVMAHVQLQDTPTGQKQLPKAVGQALGPDIPSYFNNMVCMERKASGKRLIHTMPTHDLDLKNEKPFKFERTLEADTGLAEFFATLRGK